MELKKCQRCGEMYSPTYRKCPFCEEGDYMEKNRARRRGRHVSERKRTHSARGPMLAVLLVVLAVLTWYLFGENIIHSVPKGTAEPDAPQTQETPNIEPVPAEITAVQPQTQDETTVKDPAEEQKPAEPIPEEQTTAVPEQTPDTSQAQLNRDDFTLKAGETFQLKVSGTEAKPKWSVKDAAVVLVDENGLVKGLSDGTTTITASFGDGKELLCVVRVKGGSAASSSQTATTSAAAALNRRDFTLSVGEKFQLKVSGTTEKVSWSIANGEVASISSDGTVKGLKSGTTTAYAKFGGVTLSCKVRVN